MSLLKKSGICIKLANQIQTTFEFTPNAQIWPRAQNSELGGEAGKIYLITADLGNNSGTGLDFISECGSHKSDRIYDGNFHRWICVLAKVLQCL